MGGGDGHEGADGAAAGSADIAIIVPPKRKPGESADLNRNHITRAALTVLDRDGRNFGYADVAAELGVTRSALYRHFKSLDALHPVLAEATLRGMPPRRMATETGAHFLQRLVQSIDKYAGLHPHRADLAGTQLAGNPWIHPPLILNLSKVMDELGVETDQHFAALRLALALIVNLLTQAKRPFWNLPPSDWPASVLAIARSPGSNAPTLKKLSVSKSKKMTKVGPKTRKALGDALLAGLKSFAKPKDTG